MGFTNDIATEPSHARPSANSHAPNQVAPCRHDVQFYFDDRFLVGSVAAFVGNALEAGTSAVVVATRSHRDSLIKELEHTTVDLTGAIAQGRYLALDAAETLAQFTVNGVLDEARFCEIIGNVISCAVTAARNDRKSTNVVIFGEMVTLLWQRGEAQAALRLEQFWNRLSELYAFHLRCGYPIAGFDRGVHRELFSQICAEHEHVIPAEGFTGVADENERLRAVARLQQTEQVLKTEAEERRKAETQALTESRTNERLVKEIRQREAAEDELRRFTRRLLTARDEEQRRIAAELHENTAQLLSALSLYFGVLNEEKDSLTPRLASVVASSRVVSDSLLNEIRKLSHLLHPPTLDDMGLAFALKEYIEQFQATHQAKVDLEVSNHLGRFNWNLEIAVFRIVEEALANLYPISANSFATVRLSRSSDELLLEIQNHQSGTSPTEAAARVETRIMGIHTRVMEHGGTVQFTSGPAGTLISVKLPLA